MYRSNRIEVLVGIVASQLGLAGGDPLAPVSLIVGSRGMERYLRLALARHLGICAHVAFPFPAAALDLALGRERPDPDPWSPGALQWAVLEALGPTAHQPGCRPLADYLAKNEADRPASARTLGLARHIAAVFDRYAIWRPELTAEWRRDGGTDWQAVLWRGVEALLGPPPSNRASEIPPPKADEPLRFFAIATLPPPWLAALATLAERRDVEFYLLCASEGHWSDLGEGAHPLVASWGRLARDFQRLLSDVPEHRLATEREVFVDRNATRPTALHQLQSDLRGATPPSESADFPERTLALDDRSIQFHDCHGPSRQVEVLRDVLLGVLDTDPTLQPRDIVVMTPDLDTFAPLFSAVFGRGDGAPGEGGTWETTGSPRLPFEITDLAMRRANPVADALLRVVALASGRAGATEVLDLLALEPVANRFGLDREEVARLRELVFAAGIRWATDAGHRAAHDQPEDAHNTWRFGLDRLLLGAVMRDAGRVVVGVRPHDALEGAEIRLLGSLCEFTGALFAAIDTLQAPRPVAAWVEALSEALIALTRPPATGAWLGRSVRETLSAIAAEASAGQNARPIAREAMQAALEGRFDLPSPPIHSPGSAIALCGMVPERAVPHRVVCWLGMDDGAFPRLGERPAFDLLAAEPRAGDRSPRDEDQALLLEAVLSARDQLIVCYTGRDRRTNEERPPAVPVSELRDALDATWPSASPRPSEQLTRRHPLQAFDPRNFDGTGAPFSFDRRLLGTARAAARPRTARPPFLVPGVALAPAGLEPPELELTELLRFWQHPVRAFVRRRFGLWLQWESNDDTLDREPIQFDWLSQADLLREALARGQAAPPADFRDALRAKGALPLGNAGDVALDTTLALAAELEGAASEVGWRPPGPEPLPIDVPVGDTRLVGHLSGCTSAGLVALAYGDERPVELLKGWIQLLTSLRHDPTRTTRAWIFFGRVKTNGELIRKTITLDAAGAAGHLDELVALARLGRASALPWYPKASLAFAKADREEPHRAAEAAANAWATEDTKDAYHRHLFGDQAPFLRPDGSIDAAFARLATRVWGPILDAREVG